MYNRIKDGTKSYFKVGVMKEIIRIEAKPSIEIPIVTLVEIINKIPKGRLTRIKDIENAFKTFYGVDIIRFECIAFLQELSFENNYFLCICIPFQSVSTPFCTPRQKIR